MKAIDWFWIFNAQTTTKVKKSTFSHQIAGGYPSYCPLYVSLYGWTEMGENEVERTEEVAIRKEEFLRWTKHRKFYSDLLQAWKRELYLYSLWIRGKGELPFCFEFEFFRAHLVLVRSLPMDSRERLGHDEMYTSATPTDFPHDITYTKWQVKIKGSRPTSWEFQMWKEKKKW